MSVCYERAEHYVLDMAYEIIGKHHSDLKKADVKLCILMAFTGDDSNDPPVKLHGYPCAAVVSIIPLKQRADKRADAEIIIDQKAWDDYTEPRQRALLDHQITHLEIQKDEHGFVKTDDIGRPKLKMRLHDWEIGGFRSIAQRYGDDAIEVTCARDFRRNFGDVVGEHAERAEMFAR